MTNTVLREPSELVEKLQALRRVCDACNQPLYVQILDEVLPEIERLTPTPEPCRLREALVEARARLECIANSEAFFPDEEQGIVTFADALQKEAREGLAEIDSALSASPTEPSQERIER